MLNTKQKVVNASVVMNATQLSSNIIRNVAGNEIADSVDGVPLSDILETTVSAKIGAKLARYSGGKK